ncbi:hypothetical protein ACIBCO_27795 [Streptomyces violascens]|uniref:hypothetical protein n=1 Tax=Streptomyces violascens TaxID=67381 RepID=UPI00379FCA03
MEAIIASAIAVLGTLLGSGITLAFQRHAVEQGHRFTRGERLRQERLDAYSAYAGALLNYRRVLVHLWFCSYEEPPRDDVGEVRMRSYALRSSAQEALFRVQMLTDDVALSRAAEEVLDDITALYRVDDDRAELDARRRDTREGIRLLVGAAKRQL